MKRGSAASLRDAPATAVSPAARGISRRRGQDSRRRTAATTSGWLDVTFAKLLRSPRRVTAGKHPPLTGIQAVTTYTPPYTTARVTDPDWQVLVLFTDDTEKDVKGIWGPFTTVDNATHALDELRQWPLDGFWDIRRLNKFVAAKAGNEPNQALPWTWQTRG